MSNNRAKKGDGTVKGLVVWISCHIVHNCYSYVCRGTYTKQWSGFNVLVDALSRKFCDVLDFPAAYEIAII